MKLVAEKLARILKRDWVLGTVVFLVGFLAAYSASAEVAPPSQADWEAWGKLKPVKKFDYNKVYDSIDADLARLEVKESQYAQNLPIQAKGPMNAIQQKSERARNSRLR